MSRSSREFFGYIEGNYRAAGNRTPAPEKGHWGCLGVIALALICVGGVVALVVRAALVVRGWWG